MKRRVFEYKVEDNGCTITKYRGKNSTTLLIPSEFDGIPVVKIGIDAFEECMAKTIVIIPSIREIEAGAFGYSKVENVIIHSSILEKIGDSAFFECINLKRITIPDSVTSIGMQAFEGCESLEQINLPPITTIKDSLFMGCTSLISVNIPDTVKTIEYCAFKGCKSVTTANIPNSIKTILRGAFSNCENLKTLIIPDNIEKIDRGIIDGSNNIEKIVISKETEHRLFYQFLKDNGGN